MTENTTLLADLDEIVFETRDKDYGAYQLRKRYRNYLLIAALIAMFAFLSATAGPLVYKVLFSGAGDDELNIDKNVVVTAINLDVPPPPEEEPPPPVEAPPPKIAAIEFKVPVPKPDEEIVEEETIHEMEEIEEETNIGTEDVEGDDEGYDFGNIEGTGKVAAVEEKKEEEPDPNAFIMVEKEPAPVNMDDIKKLIGYPAPAKEADIEGKVVLRILVGPDGKYVKHIVVKNPHNILTSAVEAQIRNLSFTPGVQAGKPIKVWVTIPFDFKLMR